TREAELGLKYVLSWSPNKHLVKAGFDVPDWNWQTYEERSNFDGTFNFASLADYQMGRPYSFVQARGDGLARVRQKTFGLFVQDNVQLRRNLTLGLGLRYDWQSIPSDSNNLAPRVSLAYSPGEKSRNVFRAGFGIFYDRLRSWALRDAMLYDGRRLTNLILSNPGYPDPFTGGAQTEIPPPSIVRFEDPLRLPYLMHYNFGWEHRLASGTTLSATYVGMRGVGRFRSLDANAPIAPDFFRPDPSFGQIRQVGNSGSITSHGLELGVRGRLTSFFEGLLRYEYGRTYSNADRMSTLPANSYNLESEWSRSDRDRRHGFRMGGVLRAGKWFRTGIIFRLRSGSPYSMTTGRDDNQDGIARDRPAGVARNTLEGPGYARLDLRWSRDFSLWGSNNNGEEKGPRLTVDVDAFNVLNQVNYEGYVGNLSSPFFGRPVSADPARRLQLGLRVRF
ncbi:MAG: TonB-dependent receptor domain-containing protein, partial [Bryobacteraceae bacterium]